MKLRSCFLVLVLGSLWLTGCGLGTNETQCEVSPAMNLNGSIERDILGTWDNCMSGGGDSPHARICVFVGDGRVRIIDRDTGLRPDEQDYQVPQILEYSYMIEGEILHIKGERFHEKWKVNSIHHSSAEVRPHEISDRIPIPLWKRVECTGFGFE